MNIQQVFLRDALYKALMVFDPTKDKDDAVSHQMEYLRVKVDSMGKVAIHFYESDCLQHVFYGRDDEILPMLVEDVQKSYDNWVA